MFEVKIDFNDQSAAPNIKRVAGFSELGLYLERIPNMLGFLANDEATITIKKISSDDAIAALRAQLTS